MHPSIPNKPITRFAPSPTGYLHLGHVVSMAFVFGIASLTGAKVLLRIEDVDQERSRSEYEKAILDDMAWLDFIPDNWNAFSTGKTPSIYRQSDCRIRHEKVLSQLENQRVLYRCTCSRKQLVLANDGQEWTYPGTCRNKNNPPESNSGVRMMIDDQIETFDDLIHGTLEQNPALQCGDLLLKDRRGCFTYHFAVVVDDIEQGVNFIIRGNDLLDSTGRQLALSRQLGASNTPLYLHHPLIKDNTGEKLSKRTFSEGIINRRQTGDTAEHVIGDALYLAGIIKKKMLVKASEVSIILSDTFKGVNP